MIETNIVVPEACPVCNAPFDAENQNLCFECKLYSYSRISDIEIFYIKNAQEYYFMIDHKLSIYLLIHRTLPPNGIQSSNGIQASKIDIGCFDPGSFYKLSNEDQISFIKNIFLLC